MSKTLVFMKHSSKIIMWQPVCTWHIKL